MEGAFISTELPLLLNFNIRNSIQIVTGQRFAIYEMKSSVAAILRNYKLMPVTRPEDIEFVSDIVLRSNGPVYVQFEKRVDSV